MPNDWRACKEFLERRFPERWCLKQAAVEEQPRHEVYVVREEQLSADEWERKAQRILHGSPSKESS
jgi:hypothetical protein